MIQILWDLISIRVEDLEMCCKLFSLCFHNVFPNTVLCQAGGPVLKPRLRQLEQDTVPPFFPPSRSSAPPPSPLLLPPWKSACLGSGTMGLMRPREQGAEGQREGETSSDEVQGVLEGGDTCRTQDRARTRPKWVR